MPRTVRDSAIETRAARARLKARPDPYYRAIEEGLHVGYRRNKDGHGKWVVRLLDGNRYRVTTIGRADDLSDADGAAVLSFKQAQGIARAKLAANAPKADLLTVAAAIQNYLASLSPAAQRDAASKFCMVPDELLAREVASLEPDDIRRWHVGLAAIGPWLGTAPTDEEAQRRRRSTANRVLTMMRACLNHAYRDGKVPSDVAWKRVKPFRNVDKARDRFLTIEECRRLINACDPQFRSLVQAALLTGCRYGELCRLVVCDFEPRGSLLIQFTKSGKSRRIELTEEGRAFFEARTAGRPDDALMFTNNGGGWGKGHQVRRMDEACKRAGISSAVFHSLRHSWASLALMNGLNVMVVASNLGHADTRMVERTYGHLTRGFVRQAISDHAPKFGFDTATNVQRLK